MAFQLGTVDFIVKTLLPRLEHRGRVLSLARQRITCPVAELIEYLESEGFSPDREHMAELSPATSKELFESLGFDQYDDLDFTPVEGVTIVHDMNKPVPEEYHDRYDLIFEMGTMEHIFDVRSTFDNIIKMLKVGGTVFHLAPLNFLNHGFYNFSPGPLQTVVSGVVHFPRLFVTLQVIDRPFDIDDPRVFEAVHHLLRIVRRGVIDDNELKIRHGLP